MPSLDDQSDDLDEALTNQSDDLDQVADENQADDDDADIFKGMDDDQDEDEDPVRLKYARGSLQWRGGEAVVFTEPVD